MSKDKYDFYFIKRILRRKKVLELIPNHGDDSVAELTFSDVHT